MRRALGLQMNLRTMLRSGLLTAAVVCCVASVGAVEIFPVAELRPGQQATVWTVFEGYDADSFLGQCWKLAEGFRGMNVAHSIFAEDGGYLVYTFGDFSIGELVKVRDGRISEIYVTYNSTY